MRKKYSVICMAIWIITACGPKTPRLEFLPSADNPVITLESFAGDIPKKAPEPSGVDAIYYGDETVVLRTRTKNKRDHYVTGKLKSGLDHVLKEVADMGFFEMKDSKKPSSYYYIPKGSSKKITLRLIDKEVSLFIRDSEPPKGAMSIVKTLREPALLQVMPFVPQEVLLLVSGVEGPIDKLKIAIWPDNAGNLSAIDKLSWNWGEIKLSGQEAKNAWKTTKDGTEGILWKYRNKLYLVSITPFFPNITKPLFKDTFN